jgi:hypothetical protein
MGVGSEYLRGPSETIYGAKYSNIVASREKYNKYATASCDEHQEHVRYSAAVPGRRKSARGVA